MLTRATEERQALSLSYGNLSLLILSIDGSADKCLPWVLALNAVGIVQVALGARLHDSLVLGFVPVPVETGTLTPSPSTRNPPIPCYFWCPGSELN